MKLDAIAKELNISYDSFWRYKKEHSELSEILSTAKEKLHAAMLIKAEDSLLTLITGQTVEETSIETGQGKDGPFEKTTVKTRVIPPNPAAVIFTLKNRDPDNWKDRTELDARVLHGVIPEPLAPVKTSDIIEAEPLELESGDETDNSV